MNEYAKALEDLDLALKINPEYTKAIVKKGDVMMGMKEWDKALRFYSQAHESNPQMDGISAKIK